MIALRSNLAFVFTYFCCATFPMAQDMPRHYAFFGFERVMIHDEAFLDSKFEGAQLRYSWRELEPEKDTYNLDLINDDLEVLSKAGKRLFIQIQDVSFDKKWNHVPRYLMTDEYNGGADLQFTIPNDDESKAEHEGWVARRWDPVVQERFYALLEVLGTAFDGKVEGINLCETAVGFGESGELYPEGFTPERYRDAIIEIMAETKKHFPNSVVIQYANFMPGDWQDGREAKYLADVFKAAHDLGVGVGGPDIKVNRRWQMFNSYPLIQASAEKVPTGVAVQWGNYEEVDRETGKQVMVESIYTFGKDYLKLDYIFWGIQPPYFKDEVYPFVNGG